MQYFENFISYRRKDTQVEVKTIYEALKARGYSTFCDIYTLNNGKYDSKLISAIDNCTNYILVLGPNSLARCFEKDDWLYAEMHEALIKKKNIVCVFVDGFHFPDVLPEGIEDIHYENGLKYNVEYFDHFIDSLVSRFLVKEDDISVSDEKRDFLIINDVLVKYVGTARNVTIPSNVRVIAKEAFKDQTRIKNIVFSDGVEVIQESAFERCTSISLLELPNGLKKIEKKAFCRCYNVGYIAINEQLEFIGEEAFGFCGKLKNIRFNDCVSSIDATAFNNCSMLMEFDVSENNQYYSVLEGVLFNKDFTKVIRCPENYHQDIISLPTSVTTIGEWCFSRCMKLIDVVLPKTLVSISGYAFQDCCNIVSLTLGDTIEDFDVRAIEGWNEQQKIIMGKKFNPLIKYSIEQKLKELVLVEREIEGNKFCLVKTAFESEEEAVKMAKMLLDNNLIVSGQIKKMKSLYIWDDKLCKENEIELTCFTETRLYHEVEKFINNHHSYELCQVIAIPIMNISEEFGNWIVENTGSVRFDY
ncbi:MAG: divalent cation tolerance protein CutA [Clostridia bacterium]|nr:divalent cation tolerance protein CutA [Clostridia bacterium]